MVAGLLIAVAVIAIVDGMTGLQGAHRLATTIGAMIALFTPVLAWLWRQGSVGGYDETVEALARSCRALVRAQREQWSLEDAARRTGDPWPLPVRWAVTARAEAMMPSWAAIRGARDARPVDMDGRYEAVASVFRSAGCPGRLAIVGGPGAGKSVLILRLALDLLDRAVEAPDDPVPVLLPIAGWDPHRAALGDWLTERLAADYRELRQPTRAADGSIRSVAEELVRSGRILPLLDGLDELAAGSRASALDAVADYLGTGRSLVLTSRTEEYEAATAEIGPLAGTPVVELLPLDPADVTAYLSDGGPAPRRWDRVFEHLRQHPDGPLATVLTTPLMVWLAMVVYQHRVADPDDLLAVAAAAADRAAIERHLLGRLVPAAYRCATSRYPRRSPHHTDRANRWLAHLAQHLTIHRTHDIAWWRLYRAAGRGWLALLTGLATAAVYFVVNTLTWWLTAQDRPVTEIAWSVLGIAVPLGVASFAATVVPAHPPRAAPRLLSTPGVWHGLVFGAVVALAILVDPAVLTEPTAVPGAVRTALILGAFYGAFTAATAHPRRLDLGVDRNRARYGLRVSLFALPVIPVLLILLNYHQTVYGAAELAGFGAVILGVAAGGGVLAALTSTGNSHRVPSPARSLVLDRAYSLGIAALSSIVAVAVLHGTLAMIIDLGVALALTTTQWARFTLARAVLAARGQAPVRLMTALREAHERGVLRQTGDTYQFRHAALQHRLAESHN